MKSLTKRMVSIASTLLLGAGLTFSAFAADDAAKPAKCDLKDASKECQVPGTDAAKNYDTKIKGDAKAAAAQSKCDLKDASAECKDPAASAKNYDAKIKGDAKAGVAKTGKALKDEKESTTAASKEYGTKVKGDAKAAAVDSKCDLKDSSAECKDPAKAIKNYDAKKGVDAGKVPEGGKKAAEKEDK